MAEDVLRIYDFDNTIYDGNSTVDFFKFSVKKHKIRIVFLPIIAIYKILYKLGYIGLGNLIEIGYRFLVSKKSFDVDIREFWNNNKSKIKEFYTKDIHDNDIIISASPYLFLLPVQDMFGIKIIATRFDKKRCKIVGKLCHDQEKVSRLKELGIQCCDEFYTDSYVDAPLIKFSKKAFLVKDSQIREIWKKS